MPINMIATEDDALNTFWGHLRELRSVLIHSFIAIALGVAICLYYYAEIIQFLTLSLPLKLSLFTPQEGISSICRLSLWLGFLLTSPYWLIRLSNFIIPGLRGLEKTFLLPFLSLSLLFIVLGFTLCLKVTLPMANTYLYAFNAELGVNLWNLSSYIDYVLVLLLGHGVVFEAGAILLLLIHFKCISWRSLANKRRHAIVLTLILGALLTPPDVLTQLLLALPLYGFFELAIGYGRLIE